MAKGFLSRKTNHGGIKAMPVFMFGCHFRSRLEARWAIMFTELGVPFEYEPRCFRTIEGGYLPDFRLPGGPGLKPYWLEIKGPEPIERDYVRAEHVARTTGQKFRFLVGELPGAGSGGFLRTRVLQGGVWRPAEWRTPWSGQELDRALMAAKSHRFSDSQGNLFT